MLRHTERTDLVRGAAWRGLALALFVLSSSCSGKVTQAGGLEVTVGTNLSVPQEMAAVRVVISQQTTSGWVRHFDQTTSLTSASDFPLRYSIQAGSSADQDALIDLTGLSLAGQPVVFSETEVQVPLDRVAVLSLFLSGKCLGQVSTEADGGIASGCPAAQACSPVTGACASTSVDVTKLPAYSGNDVTGDGGAGGVQNDHDATAVLTDASSTTTADASMPSVPPSGDAASPDATGVGVGADSGPVCLPGGSCTPTDCELGAYVCVDGGLSCQSTSDVPNGTPCGVASSGGDASGAGMSNVCFNGSCTTCSAGGDCSASGSCQKKTIDCSTGQAVCGDAGLAADNTPCGTADYCYTGTCSPCTLKAGCTPSNQCHQGTVTACTNGVATCTDATTPKANGTSCGTNQVCSSGACAACTANVKCTPAAACHQGLTSCTTGVSVCMDQNANVTDGTPCGTNAVCSAGACGACVGGAACTPKTNVCHVGATSCATGVSVCADTMANVAAGTDCGAGEVCNGSGACVACVAGTTCAVTNEPCHNGRTSCTTGASKCVDQDTFVQDGTSCGTGSVCRAGVCSACTSGGSCMPTANACHLGTLSCASGQSMCVDTMANAPAGTGCGTNMVCNGAGACKVQLAATPIAFTPAAGNAFSGAIATVTDVATGDVASVLSAVITWGDGATSRVTPTGSGGTFTVSGTHTYAAPGTVTVSVTITDATTGATTSTSESVTVQCPTGLAACNGTCINETTNAMPNAPNCGGCGANFSCTGGETCQGGACGCSGAVPSLCGGACTNVATDAANCGACGAACPGRAQGESCSSSVCQAYSIVAATAPFALTTDGVRVYFLEALVMNEPVLAAVPVAGGSVSGPFSVPGAVSVATDGVSVFWGATIDFSGFLSYAPVGNIGNSTAIITDLADPIVGIVADLPIGTLFYQSLCDSMFSVLLADPFSMTDPYGANGGCQNLLAADAAQVYWANASPAGTADPIGVFTSTVFDGPDITLSNASNVQGLAVQGSFLYYTDSAGGTVSRVPTDASAAASAIASASSPGGLVADATNVYWINAAGTTIMRVPLAGGTATPVATGQSATAIAQDNGSVYWTNATSIMRFPK